MAFLTEENRIIYEQNDRILADVTFPSCGDGLVDINHTFVDESLRGQGIAAQLMERCACELRLSGRKASLTCSFAIKWFGSHEEYADVVLVEDIESSNL